MNKKLKTILIVAGACIFFIYAIWKRERNKIPNLGVDTTVEVDLRLNEEKRRTAEFKLKYEESERENDSLKAIIESNNKKIISIRKKRHDEAVIDYTNWNADSITSAFANRYGKK